MSLATIRSVTPLASLGVVGLAVLIVAVPPAQAQDAAGGISTTIPTLEGAVNAGAPDAVGASPPASGLPVDGGVGAPAGTQGGGGGAAQPPGRFPMPKSTAKTKDRVREPRKGPPPLPPLQAYPTAVRLRGGGATIDTVGEPTAPAPTVAALPVTPRLRARTEDAPYDPVGIDLGAMRLTPFVTESLGFDSNPDQTQYFLRPSFFERTDGGLGIVSTWSRNEFRADLRGGYDVFFSDPRANRPDATGTIDYRYDVDRDTALDTEARFALDTQRIGSPEVAAGAQTRPLVSTFGASLGGSRAFGRLTFALHGSIDRTAYDNALDDTGVLQDLASENFTDYGLRLRATYELTPVLRPFVDLFGDDRVHDSLIDDAGYRRDSTGGIAQVGSTFELTRLLTGELAAGYGNRTYQDPRLKAIDGPVFNGLLAYAVTPLTTVSLRAATTFDETTVAGASGTESRSASLEVTHALLRNLTITGALSYLNTDYVGVPITENTLAETVKAEYHLTRFLVATATYSHEALSSTLAGASFTQDVALIGLRLQR